MANGFPANITRQAGGPISSSDINALAAAVNQSAPAKVTAAGQIPVGIGLNEIAALAAPLVSGLSLVSDLAEPGKVKWGSGIGIGIVSQTSNYTITSSYGTITGLTKSVTTTADGALVIVLVVGALQIPSNASNVLVRASINAVVDDPPSYFNNECGTTLILPFSYLHYETVASAGTFDVFVEAIRSAGGGAFVDCKMLVFVVNAGGS